MNSAICHHLQLLLDAELAAGNTMRDQGPSPANPLGRMVLLARPFVAAPATLPDTVTLHQVNDPHWWLAEYQCGEHGDLLACAFS